MNKTKLIIGLGNPDPEYQNTRHNVGFMFLDYLARRLVRQSFSVGGSLGEGGLAKKTNDNDAIWEFDKKSNSLVLKSELKGLTSKNAVAQNEVNVKKTAIILTKPQTYVNKSGEAVKKLIENCKLKIENLVVIHDDLDIPFGNTKISFDKNSGGHKGVESIMRALKTKKFYRLRIGLAKSALQKARQQSDKSRDEYVVKLVLSKFTPAEQEQLKNIFKEAYEKVLSIMK